MNTNELLPRLKQVTPNCNGWTALCPAHDDHTPSLSIATGDDGRILLHCHSGCSVKSISAALGLELRDLMPSIEHNDHLSTKNTRNKKPARVFATSEDAIADLERQRGKCSAQWMYHDVGGEPVGGVLRWETRDGKNILPVSLHADGWRNAAMPEPRLLYRLPTLTDASCVLVVEGEKCADEMASLGLITTTSSGGSHAAMKTDWMPLAGLDCIILPDADEPGEKYAETVAGILHRQGCKVRILHLPDIEEGSSDDVADFINERRTDTKDDEAIAREVIDLAAQVKPWSGESESAIPHLHWRPFPTSVLPSAIGDFIYAAAAALGCDESLIALPVLAVCAASIGTSRTIRLKRTWCEPAILWTVPIVRSGGMKSPAMDIALKPLREQESEAFREHAELMTEHENAMMTYERKLSLWRKAKGGGDPPVKPKPPICTRYTSADCTTEALAMLLLDNPRGLLLARDELAGWLQSFDTYRSGKGGDAAKWLELHRADTLLVDRKSGEPKTIRVNRAAVSLCGTIQPGTLRRCLSREHFQSGLAARILMAMPPVKVKRWTDDELPEKIERAYAAVIDRLLALQPSVNEHGETTPIAIPLTKKGLEAWIAFYNEHAQTEAAIGDDDLAAAFSKLEGYAARLALIVHCIRQVSDESVGEAVDELSITAGVKLARWFSNETQRIYAVLGGDEADDRLRHLAEWIQRKGGQTTPRKVLRHFSAYQTAGEAKAALNELRKAGYGNWDYAPQTGRGRPSQIFALKIDGTDTDNNTVNRTENGNIVGVGSDRAQEKEAKQ